MMECVAWHGMTWHGVAWSGIGLNYTYKEILNALKTKGRCKDIPLLVYAEIQLSVNFFLKAMA